MTTINTALAEWLGIPGKVTWIPSDTILIDFLSSADRSRFFSRSDSWEPKLASVGITILKLTVSGRCTSAMRVKL